MSHSPLGPKASGDPEADAYAQAHRTLVKLLREGMSWSGLERDCLFLNTGDGRFATASAVSGLDFAEDGRGLAATDWDRDGDLDLIFAQRSGPRLRFMRNDAPGSARSLSVKLRGSRGNLDAFGARLGLTVTTPAGTRTLVKGTRAGEGYLSQGTSWITFGLGDATTIGPLTVRWPGGASETFTGLAAGKRYLVAEGSGRVETASAPAAVTLAAAAPPAAEPDPSLVTLRSKLPAPTLDAETFGGSALRPAEKRPVLLNLWASWCKPCRAELADIASRRADLARAGIDVLALSVDGLGDTRGADASAPERLLRDIGFTLPAGRAAQATVHRLQTLENLLLSRDRPLPVPTSFLIDATGSVVAIARGSVAVDDVIALLGPPSPGTRLPSPVPFPGRWHVEPDPIGVARAAQAFLDAGDLAEAERYLQVHEARSATAAADPAAAPAELNLGNALAAQGKLADASRHLRAALRFDPDLVEAHVSLAAVNAREGDLASAREHLQKALALRPGDPAARHNLEAITRASTGSAAAEAAYRRGTELLRQGDRESAVRAFQQALDAEPTHTPTLLALASTLESLGRREAAIPHLKEALRLSPGDAETNRKLGITLSRLGRFEAAIPHFRAAIEADPADASAHLNLGLALAGAGGHAEAEAAFRAAITRDARLAAAHGNLGTALHRQGKLREAMASYREALAFEPGHVRARLGLAWILATSEDVKLRNGREAVHLAEGACPPSTCLDPPALDVQAAAHAEIEQFADARTILDRALDHARNQEDRDRLRERLLAYRAGKPYRTDRYFLDR